MTKTVSLDVQKLILKIDQIRLSCLRPLLPSKSLFSKKHLVSNLCHMLLMNKRLHTLINSFGTTQMNFIA